MPILETTDNFNRADENPLAGNWITVGGNSAMAIVSNVATFSAIGSDCASRWATSFAPDQYSQAKLTVTGTTIDTGPGLIVRADTSAQTYYRVTVSKNATNISVYKFVTGTFTLLWQRAATFVDGDTVRLEIRGHALRVSINGVPVGADFTDTSIVSGRPGICYSSSATAATIDDWAAADIPSIPLPQYPIQTLFQGLQERDFFAAPSDEAGVTDAQAADAPVTIIAADTQINMLVNALSAALTFAAANAQITEAVNAIVAAMTWAASNPQINIAINPTNAPITFIATNPSVVTGTLVNAIGAAITLAAANAQANIKPSATGSAITLTASNAQVSIKPSAQNASMTFAASVPQASVKPSAQNAAFTFTAANATVLTGTMANAIAAAVALAANAPQTSVKPSAQNATMTFTASNPAITKLVAAQAAAAAMNLVATNASVTVSGNINVDAVGAVLALVAANAQGMGDVYTPPRIFDNLTTGGTFGEQSTGSGTIGGSSTSGGFDGTASGGDRGGQMTGGGSVEG